MGISEKAGRILQAAVVEANGRPGMYVLRDGIMSRAPISDVAEFLLIAVHFELKGWIAEAEANYGVFVLKPEGADEAMN